MTQQNNEFIEWWEAQVNSGSLSKYDKGEHMATWEEAWQAATAESDKLVTELQATIAELKELLSDRESDLKFENESRKKAENDADSLLDIIGLGVDSGRTDGGVINVSKVRAYQKETITTLMDSIQHRDNIISELEKQYSDFTNKINLTWFGKDTQIKELQTQNNYLREALERLSHLVYGYYPPDFIKDTLASTPAQHINDDMRIFSKDSLQAHDNEVIEQVICIVNAFGLENGMSVIETIRALKHNL